MFMWCGMQVAAVILSDCFYGSSWEQTNETNGSQQTLSTFWEHLGIQDRLLCRWMPLGYTSSPAMRQGWSITWIGIVCSALDCRRWRGLPFPQELIGTHWNTLEHVGNCFSLRNKYLQLVFTMIHNERSSEWCIDRLALLALCSSGKPMWITEIACSDPNSPERLSAEVG